MTKAFQAHNNQMWIYVSDEAYAEVEGYVWSARRSGNTYYAERQIRTGGVHHFIKTRKQGNTTLNSR